MARSLFFDRYRNSEVDVIDLRRYLLLLLALPWGAAVASTTLDGAAKCTYIDGKGDVKLMAICAVNVGLTSAAGNEARYVLTFPNKAAVTIYATAQGATVNGQPAKIAYGNHRIAVVTKQDEVFIFAPPTEE